MKRPWADGVFLTCCDEDIVVLDTRADLYSCLPQAAAHLTLHAGAVEGPRALVLELLSAGILCDGPGTVRRSLPSRPSRALSLEETGHHPGDALAVVTAMIAAWTHGPGRRPLCDLIADPPRRADDPADLARITGLTRAFVRLLPWDPAQGACLYRAWLLRRILASRGQRAAWVFGVRTWPFGAHCWLQIDDTVLDDDPERVALYTPIMVV